MKKKPIRLEDDPVYRQIFDNMDRLMADIEQMAKEVKEINERHTIAEKRNQGGCAQGSSSLQPK